jgi:hypothetical protein
VLHTLIIGSIAALDIHHFADIEVATWQIVLSRRNDVSLRWQLARAAVFAVGFGIIGYITDGPAVATKPIPAINNDAGLALKGYDPVAYFTDRKPLSGDSSLTAQWHGVTWRFVSAAHRDSFLTAPERYAPQYGGYCAFAIAHDWIADIDPGQWAVVGGKLYLNNGFFSQIAWNFDRPGNIRVGDRNWPLVPKLPQPAS